MTKDRRPTYEELDAHARTGGRWRCTYPDGRVFEARNPEDSLGVDGALWTALDADDRPTAWPTLDAEAAS